MYCYISTSVKRHMSWQWSKYHLFRLLAAYIWVRINHTRRTLLLFFGADLSNA